MHSTTKDSAPARNGILAAIGSAMIDAVLVSSVALPVLLYKSYSSTEKDVRQHIPEVQTNIFKDLNAVNYQIRIAANGTTYRIVTNNMMDSPNACLVSVYAEKKSREEPASIKDLETDILESGPDFAKSRDKISMIYSLLRTFCAEAPDMALLKPDTGI